MATQALTKHGFLHNLETTASTISHGIAIAHAIKAAIPVARTLGTAAMALL